MDINSAFNNGLLALMRADAGLRRNAEAIARNTPLVEGSETIHTALVESAQLQRQAEIAVAVIEVADETQSTLIDTYA